MPTQYTVQQGDCISSIAAQFGIPRDKLWNDPGNAQLKTLRKDLSVLLPGDQLTIPDLVNRQESRPTDALHSFKKKVDPTHIKIRLLIDGEPRSSLAYQLTVGVASFKGSTDGDGFLQADIPPNATTGTLVAGAGTSQSVYSLTFGALDPIETNEGVRERLVMLGFDADDALEDAVQGFQTQESMTVTGVVDDALRARLKEKFGQ